MNSCRGVWLHHLDSDEVGHEIKWLAAGQNTVDFYVVLGRGRTACLASPEDQLHIIARLSHDHALLNNLGKFFPSTHYFLYYYFIRFDYLLKEMGSLI